MQIGNHRCIAVVGGGGKTSLIYDLAGRLCSQGKKVIIGTSTHMFYEHARPFALWTERQQIRQNLEQYGYTVTGIFAEEKEGRRKITCPEGVQWGELLDMCDVLLIEADGSKGLPLKIPAEHEPVIPKEADLVIGTAGLDALGRPIAQVCHRSKLTAAFLEKSVEEVVTEADMVKICTSALAMGKGVEGREYAILLNKADTRERREAGERIREAILCRRPETEVEVTSLRKQKIGILLLAAGSSRRFGAANKLLYALNGKTLFARIIEKMEALHCGSLTVVTQPDFGEIAKEAGEHGAKVLYNPCPEAGIASSIRIALEGAPPAEAYLISVCDQPYLQTDTLERLIEAYAAGGEKLAVLSCRGEMGNPAIFSAAYQEELLSLTGDRGGKGILRRHQEDVTLCEVADERELLDMDVPPVSAP